MRRRIIYPDDCLELQKKILHETQFALTLNEVQEFWEWRSDCVCASWLFPDYTTPDETLEDLVHEWVEAEDA